MCSALFLTFGSLKLKAYGHEYSNNCLNPK